MAPRRRVEILSAGCPVCTDTIELVRRLACDSCDVVVLDMADRDVAARARRAGVRTVPAVLVGGRLAACCAGRGPDEAALRAAGLGQPLG
jgi:glutaredoxin